MMMGKRNFQTKLRSEERIVSLDISSLNLKKNEIVQQFGRKSWVSDFVSFQRQHIDTDEDHLTRKRLLF